MFNQAKSYLGVQGHGEFPRQPQSKTHTVNIVLPYVRL